MAQTTLSGLLWPHVVREISTSVTSLAIDGSGEKVAMIVRAPKTGAVRKAHFRLGAVTSAQTLLVSLQDVDLATGDADGTADQSGTVAVAGGDSNTWKTATFGSDRSVTRGDLFAVVVEFDSAVGNLNINVANTPQYGNLYPSHYTTAWSKQAREPIVVLEYSDGSFAPMPGVLAGVPSQVDFNDTSSPDERGSRIVLPFPATCGGIVFRGRLTGACDLVLYEGTTALATASLDPDVETSTSDLFFVGMFNATVALAKDTVYRAVMKPTSASNVRVYYADTPSAAAMAQMPGGTNVYGTNRVDAGSWSDEDTRRYGVFLLLEGFDNGVSTGGGQKSRYNGGFN